MDIFDYALPEKKFVIPEAILSKNPPDDFFFRIISFDNGIAHCFKGTIRDWF